MSELLRIIFGGTKVKNHGKGDTDSNVNNLI